MNKKKLKSRFKSQLRKFVIFIILVLCLGIYLYVQSNIIVQELALAKFEAINQKASFEAITETLLDEFNYEDLMSVTFNDENQVVMVTANSLKVNSLASKVVNNTYDYLQLKMHEGIDVPIGAFTGLDLFSGLGATVNMNVLAISNVSCKIISSFETAGINQTRHTLILLVEPQVYLSTTVSSQTVDSKIEILIYDNILVGKVPEFYIDKQIIGQDSK